MEALDREEKELDQRLKELQLKGTFAMLSETVTLSLSLDCTEINNDPKYNTNGTYINMRCEQPKYALGRPYKFAS